MIPNSPAPAGSASDFICRQLLQGWAGRKGSRAPQFVNEAARAVAAYCERDLASQPLTERHLQLLFTRALCRVGERESARLVLGEGGDDAGGRAVSYMAVLERTASPWPAVDWLARRVYRAADFTAFPGGCCWTLDWGRLQPAAGEALEFTYIQLLRTLLREVAPLWDPTSGRGTLAHAGLARHFAGSGMRLQAVRRGWALEILDWSRLLLARTATERGWAEAPACRLLDATY
jgi:hypothetical protein